MSSSAVCYIAYVVVCGFFAYVGLGEEAVYSYLFLFLLDFATGFMSAVSAGIKVTSRRAGFGVLWKSVLLVVPLSIGIVLNNIGLEHTKDTLIGGVMGALIVAEAISIVENVISIKEGKPVKKIDAFGIILSFAKNKLEVILNRLLERADKEDDDA